MKKPLYMIVTRSRFELPVAVGDSLADLAQQTGMRQDSLIRMFNRCRRNGWRGTCKEVFVDFDEKELKELEE